MSSVPKRLAYKLWLGAWREWEGFLLAGESDGMTMAKPMKARLAKKDLKTGGVGGAPSKARDRPRHDNSFDDPGFDPLSRPEIK